MPTSTPHRPSQPRTEVPRRPASWRRRLRWSRRTAQAAVVALVAGIMLAAWRADGSSAEVFCPFGGFETLWTWLTTGRTTSHLHPANLVLAAGVALMALAARGSFCGWLCPFGSLQEGLYGLSRWAGRRIPALGRWQRRPAGTGWRRADRVLRLGRYGVLAFAVVGAGVTGTLVFRDVDPWHALIGVLEFELSLAFAVLVAVVLLSFVVPRPFCRYACPLGATLGLIGRLSPVAVERDASACLGCDLCTRACPMALQVHTASRVTSGQCIGCLECVAACPSVPALGVSVALPWPVGAGSVATRDEGGGLQHGTRADGADGVEAGRAGQVTEGALR